MIKKLILFLAVALSAYPAESAYAKAIDERIYIAPAGPVDASVLKKIKSSLPDILPMAVSVELAPEEKMPPEAYNAARGQYDASVLLEAVAKRNNLATTRESMIVVTDSDLYYADVAHVFGLSNPKAKICVISLARPAGGKVKSGSLYQRALRSAATELGYVLGLKDCPDVKCVMHLSKNPEDEDSKKVYFCHDCKKRLRSRYSSALITIPQF
ncbi:MAG TPA: hypothetical protein PLV52_04410 [Candidatus Omnitrophota bacterium]|nr:hypothetical protein [Candidatus Omnitrophota bacterium]